MAVAAGLDVGDGFEARGGRDQDGGGVAQAGADHGHVAGVVDDAVLLLERGLVLLVDHHEAEVGERQEQRGAGADHHRGLAGGDRAPGEAAGARGEVGVPDGGSDAEARLEALQPLRRQRDLGQQHQRLAALAQALRDGFHDRPRSCRSR